MADPFAPRERSVGRRTALAATLVATGTALLGGTASSAVPRQERRSGYLDVSDPTVFTTPTLLRLKFNNSATPATGQPAALSLGTSQKVKTTLTVSTTARCTRLATSLGNAQRSATRVTVEVAADEPTTIWVIPTGFGEPQQPADELTVTVAGGETMRIQAWVEPTGGQWAPLTDDHGNPLDLGIVAVHGAVMRKEKDRAEVVMYSLPRVSENGKPLVNEGCEVNDPNCERWVWDPHLMDDVETRALDLDTLVVEDRKMEPKKNIFCSGQAHQSDGNLLTVGGHVMHDHGNAGELHVYNPATSAWENVDNPTLTRNRWYPTVVTLPDGRMLIASGAWDSLWPDKRFFDQINNNYLIYDPVTRTIGDRRTLIDKDLIPPRERLGVFPGVFMVPGAQDSETVVAVVETNRGWLYRYQPGTSPADAKLALADEVYTMPSKGSRSYPTYGSIVLLPLEPGGNPRILAVGGQHEEATDHRDLSSTQESTNTAEVFEIDVHKPLTEQANWRRTKHAMNSGRVLCDATLLADGTVLVSGGSKTGWGNENIGPVNQAELFNPDPTKEEFTPAATATTERRYHSIALLLPDGTVLKAGSHGGFGVTEAGVNWFRSRTDAEVYQPPYLWRGPRPSITEVNADNQPDTGTILRYGKEFTVTAKGDLGDKSKVALIRLGATTHGTNTDQRYVWLEITKRTPTGTDWTILAKPPGNAAAAPPGDYLLVVVDKTGVPSIGKIVRVATR